MGASNIKGITIEIDGETTKLSKALKDVDSSIKGTQSSLKEVDKLLKLDPGNTDLLTQKQKLLKNAIGETKDRLETLKTAQSQVGEGTKEWESLQQEIVTTEGKLKGLEDQYKSFGSVAAQQVKAAGENLKDVGGKITGVGQDLTAKVTVPLAAAGGVAVAKFAEVDKTMQLTNATMGNSEAEAKLLSDAMKEAAANSTFGMSDAATATLNFARAGLDAEQAAAALAPAMNLAAGEGGNLDVVSAGLTATINGFGDSFDQASHYSDVFAAACNNSALDVDGLSQAMSVAAPIFSSSGKSVEDAALMMGVMANAGIDANVAANSLKTGMARLADPVKSAREAMEKYGISMDDIWNPDGTMKDIVEVQANLNESFGKLSEQEQLAAAGAIFGKNQMAPWLALINTAPKDVDSLAVELHGASLSMTDLDTQLGKSGLSLDEMRKNMAELGVDTQTFDECLKWSGGDADWFADMLYEATNGGTSFEEVVAALGGDLDTLGAAMGNTKGTTEEMADAMMSGFGGSLESLSSSIDVAATSLGEALAPAVSAVAEKIQGAVSWFNSLDSSQQTIIATIGLVVAAIGPLLVIIGTLISSIGAIMTAAPAVGAVLAALTGPIGLVIAIVAALIAIGVALYKNWDVIKQKCSEFAASVSAKWGELKEYLVGRVRETVENVTQFWEDLKEKVTTTVENLKSSVTEKWENLKKTVIEKVENIKKDVIEKWENIKKTVTDKIEEIKKDATEKWENIKKTISDAITNAQKTVSDKVSDIKKSITEGVDNAIQYLKDLPGKALSWGKDLIDNFVDGIKQKWEDLKGSVSGVAEGIADFLGFSEPEKGPLSNFHTFAPDMMKLYAQGIRDNMHLVTDEMENLAGAMAGSAQRSATVNVTSNTYLDGRLIASAVNSELGAML